MVNLRQLGEEQWKRAEKVPADLFHHLYGAIAVEMWRQSNENGDTANRHLDTLGYNMGVRMIEEVCARCPSLCPLFSASGENWKELGEALVRIVFKMYLNINAVCEFPPDGRQEMIIVLSPVQEEAVGALTRNVELPDAARNSSFHYLQPYCGIIRGALESVYWKSKVVINRDVLKGDPVSEILVGFIERMDEERPPKDDD